MEVQKVITSCTLLIRTCTPSIYEMPEMLKVFLL